MMRVKFTDAWKVIVNSFESTIYPRGWRGTLPDDIVKRAIESGKAVSVELAAAPEKAKKPDKRKNKK